MLMLVLPHLLACGDRPPAPAAAAAVAQAESLEALWTRFRRAVRASDAAAIRSMSAPVVIQRGILDDTPTVRLRAAQMPEVVARMLKRSEGVDPADRTQRALLEATPTPKRDPGQPTDYHHFGDFVFEQGASGWRLTEVYYEPEG